MKAPFNRIAFVVNHGAFFASHRLPLAIHAQQQGCEVQLFTGHPGSASMEALADKTLSEAGVVHQRVGFHSSGVNPLIELWGLFQLIWVLRQYQPDIIHCASPKGVLYGGIAARFTGVKGVVLAISGMGYAFTTSEKRSLLRSLIKIAYKTIARFSFGHPNLCVIVQNKDDEQSIIANGLALKKDVVLIPGSGVHLENFVGCSAEKKERIVLLPARMIRDKGVVEFIKAANSIHGDVPEWRFLLAGAADYKNPSAISSEEMENWQREGAIEWLGHVDDMNDLYASAAIVCLPSYREGMPKALLEAAAAGCAVVTTDVTGCREAIVNGETGDLVPARDSETLRTTLLALMRDQERRIKYGINGQARARQRFSIDAVVEQTFDIYREILKNA